MSLTPDEIESERTRFEASMTARHVNVNFRRDCTGGYEAAWVHHQWQGWLAAIESERERVRKSQQDAEELVRLQEPQRARMAEKWERGE